MKIGPLDPATAKKTLVSVRIGAGLISLAAPEQLSELMSTGAERSSLLTRMFGAREIGYGALLASPNGDVRKAILKAGLVTDLIDGISFLATAEHPDSNTGLSKANAALAFSAIGLGLLILSGEE